MTETLEALNSGLPDVNTEEEPTAHEFIASAQQSAQVASSIDYAHVVRESRLNDLLATLPDSDVLDGLQDQMRRTYKAGANLATVGYENLRKLIASGKTLPRIAAAIDVDVLELAYYMAAFDTKGDHMSFDSTLCADSQSETIAQELDAMVDPTREQVALAQVKLQLIETRNKRMSDKWAGVDAKAHLIEGAASRIVIHMGEAPSMDAYKNNPRVINSTAKVVKDKATLPLDENGRLVF